MKWDWVIFNLQRKGKEEQEKQEKGIYFQIRRTKPIMPGNVRMYMYAGIPHVPSPRTSQILLDPSI
jgi:hypothetical protein